MITTLANILIIISTVGLTIQVIRLAKENRDLKDLLDYHYSEMDKIIKKYETKDERID